MSDLFFSCRDCGHKTHQRRQDGKRICLNCKTVTSEETVNGLTILDSTPSPGGGAKRSGRVIIVDKGDGEYVTAWQGRDGQGWDSEWTWGHYIHDQEQAFADYELRAKRGY